MAEPFDIATGVEDFKKRCPTLVQLAEKSKVWTAATDLVQHKGSLGLASITGQEFWDIIRFLKPLDDEEIDEFQHEGKSFGYFFTLFRLVERELWRTRGSTQSEDFEISIHAMRDDKIPIYFQFSIGHSRKTSENMRYDPIWPLASLDNFITYKTPSWARHPSIDKTLSARKEATFNLGIGLNVHYPPGDLLKMMEMAWLTNNMEELYMPDLLRVFRKLDPYDKQISTTIFKEFHTDLFKMRKINKWFLRSCKPPPSMMPSSSDDSSSSDEDSSSGQGSSLGKESSLKKESSTGKDSLSKKESLSKKGSSLGKESSSGNGSSSGKESSSGKGSSARKESLSVRGSPLEKESSPGKKSPSEKESLSEKEFSSEDESGLEEDREIAKHGLIKLFISQPPFAKESFLKQCTERSDGTVLIDIHKLALMLYPFERAALNYRFYSYLSLIYKCEGADVVNPSEVYLLKVRDDIVNKDMNDLVEAFKEDKHTDKTTEVKRTTVDGKTTRRATRLSTWMSESIKKIVEAHGFGFGGSCSLSRDAPEYEPWLDSDETIGFGERAASETSSDSSLEQNP